MGTFSLHFVESLLMIGVPRERAQSLAELLERDIVERYSLHAQVLATKRDLADLEIRIMREMAQRNDQTNERISQSNERVSQTNERISHMEVALRSDINETRLSIAKLFERVAESKSEIIKWNLGALIAVAGVFLAFSKLPV